MENLINHNKLTLHVMEMQWITGVRQVFGYQVRYFDIHCTFVEIGATSAVKPLAHGWFDSE